MSGVPDFQMSTNAKNAWPGGLTDFMTHISQESSLAIHGPLGRLICLLQLLLKEFMIVDIRARSKPEPRRIVRIRVNTDTANQMPAVIAVLILQTKLG
jgi:hypothetical protein